MEAHVEVRKFEVESEGSADKDGKAWAEELAGHMASISALELHQKVAEKQAAITNPDEAKNPGRRVRESFVKLFTTSTMGFDLRHKDKEGKDDSSSARDSSDQSNFSKAVLTAYHPDDWQGGCGIQFLAAGSIKQHPIPLTYIHGGPRLLWIPSLVQRAVQLEKRPRPPQSCGNCS